MYLGKLQRPRYSPSFKLFFVSKGYPQTALFQVSETNYPTQKNIDIDLKTLLKMDEHGIIWDMNH